MSRDLRETDRFVFFWMGWASQWNTDGFVIDGQRYRCAEQWMMAEKARFFGDEVARKEILKATHPREMKSLGRDVRGFDKKRWAAVCKDIVAKGNLAKFTQNPELRQLLLATGDKILVEASPKDAIWGIGLAADDPRALEPSKWLGTNWLGEVLMRVRKELREGKGWGKNGPCSIDSK